MPVGVGTTAWVPELIEAWVQNSALRLQKRDLLEPIVHGVDHNHAAFRSASFFAGIKCWAWVNRGYTSIILCKDPGPGRRKGTASN